MADSKVAPSLIAALKDTPKLKIIIQMAASTSPVLESLNQREFASREERGKAVNTALTEHAKNTQKEVQEILRSRNYEFESMWINNSIVVQNGDKDLVDILANRDDIKEIKEDSVVAHIHPNSGNN